METGPGHRAGQASPVPLILLGMGNVHRELLGILARKAGGLADRYGVTFPVVACADRSGFVLGPDAPGGRVSTAAMLEAKAGGRRLREIPGAAPISLEEALDAAGPRGILLDAASMDVETGGIGLRAARAALHRGVSVVFANKSAVALAFDELEALAAANGAGLGWSATVCGGLPVVNAGRRDLVAADFRRLRGVFNSTSNLVLGRMAEGMSLEDAVTEAQRRGIAETDPTNDLNGIDTALKLLILVRTVMRRKASLADVERTGIEAAPEPAAGEVVRLVGEAVPDGDAVRMRVAPVAVPRGSFFGSIGTLDMAVEWETDLFSTQRLVATEGDAVPTAAAVLRDAVHIACGTPTGPSLRIAGS
ncbi:MAG: homoserine dehydrogenase [Acidobacteria bacterium]|nr:homoserine dehydrogenase [Acidobacteriota bacterium]MYE44266.1 homoserine dehydrogenase [Acidobacteriota bacterium]